MTRSARFTWSREIVEWRLWRVFKVTSIVFFLLLTAFPFYWMLNLSFRPFNDVLVHPLRWVPRWQDIVNAVTPITCIWHYTPSCEGAVRNSSYAAVLLQYGFLTYIRNSVIVSTITVILTLLFAIPGAYAATRMEFKGRDLMSWGILLVYMFPAIVLGIPLFVFFVRIQHAMGIRLRGNLYTVTIIYLASTLPVALYMLRSYFPTIPKDLEEAALIDGCNRLEVIWRITIPLAVPAIATVALYTFMIAWNEFLYALLFLVEHQPSWTLPLGLQQLDSQEVPRTFLMAGSVIITVPIIIIFFFFERFLTRGLTAGAVKG